MKKIDLFKNYALLHIIIVIYSVGSIFSKLASSYPFLSFKFVLCYFGLFICLAIYAIGWQQCIKRLPLTTAFSNKAITVVWGILWGVLFFKESITAGKVIGAIFVVAGVVLYAKAGEQHAD